MEKKNSLVTIQEAKRIPQVVKDLLDQIDSLVNENVRLERELADCAWQYANLLHERNELLKKAQEETQK